MKHDIVIRGGTIVDGSGGRARDGDAQAEQGEPRGVDAENRAGHEGEQRAGPPAAASAIDEGLGETRGPDDGRHPGTRAGGIRWHVGTLPSRKP